MSVSEVQELPATQKREIFEALWEEFSPEKSDNRTTVRERHILDKRIDDLESGRSQVFDWEDVKGQIGGK
ncbi:MAG: addiction module protein [Verrucomicrobiota bacterium]